MAEGGYVPGVCNIGPAEEGRRRRLGWLGVGATAAYAGVLFWTGAPPLVRLTVAIPAGLAASGWVQAKMHFCAGFAVAGFYNFNALGEEERVIAKEARRADLRRAGVVGLWSAACGIPVGVIAALIPLSAG